MEFFALHMQPIDISFGGLRIYSHEERQVGSVLRLDAFSPDVAPVTLSTEVMWIKASGKDAPAPFEMGLAFAELSSAALHTLQTLLGSDSLDEQAARESMVEPVRAPVRSSVRFTLKEPIPDVRLATPQPPASKQGVRSMLFAIPVVVDAERLRTAQLDNRAGFLLWLIDGFIPVETILDLSGMPAEETLTLLDDLLERGIVKLRLNAEQRSQRQPALGSLQPHDPIAEMRECLSSGDYESALAVADRALAREPGNRHVREFRADCRRDLEDVYAFRLRPFDRVPVVVSLPEVGIDTGAVVSLIDGCTTLESIVDACFMPRLDVLRILHDLVQRGIVAFLADTPGSPAVRERRDRSRDDPAKVCAEKLPPLSGVPVVIADGARAQCASVDHRAGFLLSLIDGTSSLETIVEACGMPTPDALRIVREMVQRGIVGFQ